MIRTTLYCTTIMTGLALASPVAAQTTLADPPAAPQTVPPAKDATSPALAPPGTPQAQAAAETQDPQAVAEQAAGEIVVTGSRVTRNGYQAPTPVTVVGADTIKEQAITRLVDISRNLPQFKNQGGARSGTNSSANQGQGGLDLRGLGTNRNLVLLDRRRVVPSTGNGVVDINIIPNALIQRVDVVTGGASAAWGSDAVSGVVNFVLDTKFEGLRAEVQGGISSRGDNQEGSVAVAGGKAFADGRGRVIASAEYYKGGRQKLLDRAWLAKKPGLVFNPGYTAINGQFQNIVASEGVVASYMTHGGLVDGCRTATGANIANCSLTGTAFGPGGTPYRFQYGTYVNATGNMIAPPGSDYVNAYTSIYDGINMVNPSERVSAFGHVEYDAAPAATLFVEGIYTRSKIGPSYSVPPYRFGTSAATWLSVSAENPYLPASIRAQMSGTGGGNPAGPAFLNVGRINDDWIPGNSETNNYNTTLRGVVGAKGDLGGGWGYDAYYQYGQNIYFATLANNLIVQRGGVAAQGNVNLAADVVAAPAGNALGVAAGTPVCRSRLTNPANGCQPLNIFGVGAASPAAIAYILGNQSTRQIYRQHVVEGSVHGDLFSTWAGPVSFAGGGSYRAESIRATSDALSQESAFGVGNPQPYAGSYNVKEGFAELVVPLAKDTSLAKSLELTAAGRYTSYSTSGGVTTWKVGATWEPNDAVRFRFTRSRDIRAPSLSELFTGALQNRASVIDRTLAVPVSLNVQQYRGGNPALNPEKADTLSGGIVLRPGFAPGFSISVDYYDIRIRDAISTLGAQDVVDRCATGNAALCALINRTGTTITSINLPFLNLASLKTRGFDIEASYRTDLDRLIGGAPGTLSLRALTNYVDSFSFSDGLTTREVAGELQAPSGALVQQPRWTVQTTGSYELGRARFALINRFIAAGSIDNRAKTIPNFVDNNHVAARIYTNLSVNYALTKGTNETEVFVNVDNVFDVKPPRGFGWGYGLNASPVYDVIGTMFKLGVRTRF